MCSSAVVIRQKQFINLGVLYRDNKQEIVARVSVLKVHNIDNVWQRWLQNRVMKK